MTSAILIIALAAIAGSVFAIIKSGKVAPGAYESGIRVGDNTPITAPLPDSVEAQAYDPALDTRKQLMGEVESFFD